MKRRELTSAMLGSALGSTLFSKPAQAQTCTSPCYPLISAEAGMTGLHLEHEPGNVLRYGADPTGATSSDAAFVAARDVAAASSAPVPIIFPAGTYAYTTSPNWALQNVTLEARGSVRLLFARPSNMPAVHAWIFDAGPSTNIYNCRMLGDFIIAGNARALSGLYVRGVHHSRFEAKVKNVTQSGCDINFCVGSSFSVRTTVDSGSFSITPVRGYHIKGRGAGEYTAWCQFHQTVIDSCSGFGIDIEYASGCSFFGGFIEYCTGGIRIEGSELSQHNSFYNIDCESNSIYDVVIYGQHNRFVGCTAFSNALNNNLIVGTGAVGTQIIGGYWSISTLQSGSELTLFQNASFSNTAAGITGAGGYHALGCYFVDPTTVVRTANMPDVLGTGVRLLNLPTSSAGLPPGSLWRSNGIVRIV